MSSLSPQVCPASPGEQHAGLPVHRECCSCEKWRFYELRNNWSVQAFGSISMMLESTFHAVHSSFQVNQKYSKLGFKASIQAVLGVAEHFSKMKLQISQVLNILKSCNCSGVFGHRSNSFHQIPVRQVPVPVWSGHQQPCLC